MFLVNVELSFSLLNIYFFSSRNGLLFCSDDSSTYIIIMGYRRFNDIKFNYYYHFFSSKKLGVVTVQRMIQKVYATVL